jgi:hypothetical protein
MSLFLMTRSSLVIVFDRIALVFVGFLVVVVISFLVVGVLFVMAIGVIVRHLSHLLIGHHLAVVVHLGRSFRSSTSFDDAPDRPATLDASFADCAPCWPRT